MVLFLNYLPHLIFIAFVVFSFIFAKRGNFKRAFNTQAVGVLSMIVVNIVLSAYGPKNTAPTPREVPRFEQSDAQIEDRLLSPVPTEEQRKALETKLDWKDRVREEEEK